MHAPYVWLITGASGGFGKCLVNSVLARGDRVIATARSLEKMGDLPKTDSIRLLQLDVTAGAAALTGIMAEAVAFWGRIDVLVNNAGYGAKALVEEAGSAEMRVQYETNVFGTLDVTTAVLPYMRAERSGTIVMIGSRTSWRPELTSTGLYASSKAALRVFSETLAVELEPFAIRMLIVEPAAFRTDALIRKSVYTDNPIPDYNAMRDAAIQRYKDMHRALRGDPAKAMEAVTDVVRGEGAAAGKQWPLYLILGDLGVKGVAEKCDRVLHLLEEWKEVSTGLDIDPEEDC
ncbi:hypothetical protein B0H17DRAFT_1010325 [Mycena rosella]|uniref:NAD(P)-binding protein n=1 Tax=Mycena rosella TaxID=1033263 RepID=A0AAD7C649_MYCRO|nr:hypothetical protein B0H17DRAFT_1339399 [Mycena rosella]KAJ7693027.1 hypothetical protein B0H17DRAFT_1010325 [Mycena rosella]